MEVVTPSIVLGALSKPLKAGTNGRGLRIPGFAAVLARSADMLDHKSCTLFKLKARGRCLQALLRETNGRELSTSRLLLYTEDDGKAWLLALLSEKLARKRKQGAGEADINNVLRSFFSVVGDVMLDKTTQWATGEILGTGLWSDGGALAGDIPSLSLIHI